MCHSEIQFGKCAGVTLTAGNAGEVLFMLKITDDHEGAFVRLFDAEALHGRHGAFDDASLGESRRIKIIVSQTFSGRKRGILV